MHITIITGYDVLKDVTATSSMFGMKSIFSTNKDVTDSRDSMHGIPPNSIVGLSKTRTVNTGAGIFYASTVRNDLRCRPFSV